MPPDNVILNLANRILAGEVSPEAASQELFELYPGGVPLAELREAFAALWNGCSLEQIETVSRIVLSELKAAGRYSDVVRTHIATGDLLAQQAEPERLVQAIQHYQESRTTLEAKDPGLPGTWLKEGNARFHLAQLGVKQSENLRAAIACYQTEAHQAGSGSVYRGQALSNLGTAYTQLSRAERSENLRTAITSYRSALQHLDLVEDSSIRQQFALAFQRTLHELERDLGENTPAVENDPTDYASLVQICQRLAIHAKEAKCLEEAETWRWEAYHWAFRSSSRTPYHLLTLPEGGGQVPPEILWNQFNAAALAASERDRQNAVVRRLLGDFRRLGIPEPTTEHPPKVQKHGALWPDSPEEDVFRHAYQELYQHLQRELTPPSPARESSPRKTVARLRAIVRGVWRGSRPLLVEYFPINENEWVVFLLPLWLEAAPECCELFLSAESEKSPNSLTQRLDEAKDAQGRGPKRQVLLKVLEDLEPLITPWADRLAPEDVQERPTELFLSRQFLHSLPLQAVKWRGQPLIEQRPVLYLPPLPSLEKFSDGKNQTIEQPEVGSQALALIIGEPLSGYPEVDDQVLRFEAAWREAEWVGECLRGNGCGVRHCHGTEATTSAVLAASPQAALLHYAGYVRLAEEDHLGGLELGDRLLTRFEIAHRLELTQTQLVYLVSLKELELEVASRRQDGLLSLAEAFLRAGASSVLTVRWYVRESVAQLFCERFFSLWVEQRTALATAFQGAVEQVRSRYKHPVDWAPFLLVGAGQNYFRAASTPGPASQAAGAKTAEQQVQG